MVVEINKEILNKAHQILFDMLCEVDTIFRKHNIRYCISFGTLLGAVRHQDFIPWDDDVDIHVFNEDYPIAIEVLRHELSKEKFILHDKISDPKYWCSFARVRDLHSRVTFAGADKEKEYCYKGLQISLLRAPLTKRANRFFYKLLKELHNSVEYNRHRKTASSFLKLIIGLSAMPICKIIFHVIEYLPGRKIRILGNMAWKGQFYYEHEIVPFCELPFRDRNFFAPRNYEKVLTDAFGLDYMTLPPLEKRIVHFSKIEFI